MAIAAWLIQPSGGSGALGVSFVILLLAAAAATASGLAVSASVSNQDRAMLMAPLLVIPQILFSGLFAPVDTLPGPVQILPALPPARWAFEGVWRLVDVFGLVGDPRLFLNFDALRGGIGPQLFALTLLAAGYSVLAYLLQARKG